MPRYATAALVALCGLLCALPLRAAPDERDMLKVGRQPDGRIVGGAVYPTGMALQGDGQLWVCSSRGNELQLLNLVSGQVEARVPVGVAPYMPVVVGQKVYVTNWGGDRPDKDPTHKTSGTPV